MRLKNSGSFCVGQVPGTSHVATRPKKHTCERRICPSLSRPFAAGPASSLFVVVQSVLDVIRVPWYNGSSSFSSYFPHFFCFSCPLVPKKKKTGTRANNIVCWCLLYFYFFFFLSFSCFFLCQSVWIRAAWCLYGINDASYCLIRWPHSCIHTSF